MDKTTHTLIDRPLIDRLAADVAPVRPLRKGRGLALAALAFAITIVLVLALLGARQGLAGGQASTFFLVVNGLLLVLGLSCTVAVVRMASPHVGAGHDGPKWAMAMAGVLPAAGLLAIAGQGEAAGFGIEGPECMALGLASSLLVGASLVAWLRRGAPVSPGLAGFYLGAGAGALGSVAYGLSCPVDATAHLGIWHVAPVVVGAVAGRFVIARLLRW